MNTAVILCPLCLGSGLWSDDYSFECFRCLGWGEIAIDENVCSTFGPMIEECSCEGAIDDRDHSPWCTGWLLYKIGGAD